MSTLEFYTSFDKQSQTLHNFAFSLTRDSEDAKDLYQETAFRALSNRDKFQPGTNFKAWLITIMKNIFINNYRRSKLKATAYKEIVYTSTNKHNSTETLINTKELQNNIDALSDDYKLPLERFISGYKYQEIAEEMNLPIGTVKSRIFFARNKVIKSYTNS